MAAIVRSRGRPAGARLLHTLAANPDPELSAAAMALILARSRRRDRFDSPRIDLDDVPAEAAVVLVHAVAAAMRVRSGGADRSLAMPPRRCSPRHDEGKRLEALSFALIHALDRAGQLDEQLIRPALADADIALTVEALARRAGLSFETAWLALRRRRRGAGAAAPARRRVARLRRRRVGWKRFRAAWRLRWRRSTRLPQERGRRRPRLAGGSTPPIARRSAMLGGNRWLSRPADRQPIGGRVDQRGRLIAADPELEQLQRDAGSRLGAALALPQLAAIARLARSLKIPVSRRRSPPRRSEDIDMWVRAVPGRRRRRADHRALDARAPRRGPKLAGIAADPVASPEPRRWSRRRATAAGRAEPAGAPSCSALPRAEAAGQPLTAAGPARRRRRWRDAAARRRSPPAAPSPGSRRGAEATIGQAVARRRAGPGADGGFAGFRRQHRFAPTIAADAEPRPADPGFNEVLRSPLRHIIDAADRMAGRQRRPAPRRICRLCGRYLRRRAPFAVGRPGHGRGSRSARPSTWSSWSARRSDFVEVAASERGTLRRASSRCPRCNARGEQRAVIQILVNLIGNAVRYSNERGTVTVSFERSGGQAVVHVADDGPGHRPRRPGADFRAVRAGRLGRPGQRARPCHLAPAGPRRWAATSQLASRLGRRRPLQPAACPPPSAGPTGT